MKLVYYFILSFSIILLDLFTKNMAERYLVDKVVSIIPGFFNLVLVFNSGAAFGMLSQAPDIIRKTVLIGSSLIAGIVTTIYAVKKYQKLKTIEITALALISGGAIGNLYDRFFLGYVRDFLDFYIKDNHWPAFNVADASISIGIGLFILLELFYKKKRRV